MCHVSKKSRGFTLLEILIALFVFTLISLIMTGALHNLMRSQAATEITSKRLARLQFALLLFSRDIEQAIDYQTIDPSGALRNFTGTPDTITFTHMGLANPFGQLHRPTIQLTRYVFSDSEFIRMIWPLPAPLPHDKPDSRILLRHISTAAFSYLDNKGKFHDTWPPQNDEKASLPRAVRIVFSLNGMGTISQLYRLPETVY